MRSESCRLAACQKKGCSIRRLPSGAWMVHDFLLRSFFDTQGYRKAWLPGDGWSRFYPCDASGQWEPQRWDTDFDFDCASRVSFSMFFPWGANKQRPQRLDAILRAHLSILKHWNWNHQWTWWNGIEGFPRYCMTMFENFGHVRWLQGRAIGNSKHCCSVCSVTAYFCKVQSSLGPWSCQSSWGIRWLTCHVWRVEMADLHSGRVFLDWLLKDVPDIKFVEKILPILKEQAGVMSLLSLSGLSNETFCWFLGADSISAAG